MDLSLIEGPSSLILDVQYACPSRMAPMVRLADQLQDADSSQLLAALCIWKEAIFDEEQREYGNTVRAVGVAGAPGGVREQTSLTLPYPTSPPPLSWSSFRCASRTHTAP